MYIYMRNTEFFVKTERLVAEHKCINDTNHSGIYRVFIFAFRFWRIVLCLLTHAVHTLCGTLLCEPFFTLHNLCVWFSHFCALSLFFSLFSAILNAYYCGQPITLLQIDLTTHIFYAVIIHKELVSWLCINNYSIKQN